MGGLGSLRRWPFGDGESGILEKEIVGLTEERILGVKYQLWLSEGKNQLDRP